MLRLQRVLPTRAPQLLTTLKMHYHAMSATHTAEKSYHANFSCGLDGVLSAFEAVLFVADMPRSCLL